MSDVNVNDFCKKKKKKYILKSTKYSVNEIKDNVAIQGVFETTNVLGTHCFSRYNGVVGA